MSVDDRLELVTFIWDSIAEDTFPIANAVSSTLGTKRFVAFQALPITGFMR